MQGETSRLIFVRHGATRGNEEGRYIGRTDLPLSGCGARALEKVALEPVCGLYASPMLRCVESARILFPGAEPCLVDGFREMDFGEFEGRTWRELTREAAFQAYIDSGGALPFPGGESRAAFCARCVRAYDRLCADMPPRAAIVAHGGTLMAILSSRARPARDYFDYRIGCGGAFVCEREGVYLRVIKRIEPPAT